MKLLLLTTLAVFSFTNSLFAQDANQFTANKKNRIVALDKWLSQMTTHKSCLNEAKTYEAMKKCDDAQKALNDAQKALNDAQKAKEQAEKKNEPALKKSK